MEHISPNLLVIISLLVAAFVGILFSIIQNKSQKIEALFDAFEKLKKSFNDLDEQAKLIVRTDLELNKAQEELDKRLDGLDALQKISRLISTTLVENEIFKRLDQALTTNLKFEKSLILTYTEKGTLSDRVTIGFNQKNIPSLLGTIENNTDILKALREGRPLSSATSSQLRRELLSRVFNTEHFIFSPILSQKGVIGLVFVGAPSSATNITAGDEEIISVLASLIGQTLENAKSFDEVFRSGQILEMKVADRTKQLESALTKVQNINKVKSEFISAVSHELRTPLTSIKGYAAILMAGKLGDIPAQVKKRLEKINSHSDKLVNLINELLDISRIESGRVEMKITSCNLGEIIETVKDLLSPQIKDKNIQWSSTIDNDVPPIPADDTQIDRIFINLVGNAIKFTPENGSIKIHAGLSGDFVEVAVTDTGIGISQDDIARLFDEFYRVDNPINQNVKGTGLGLPLAKKIVEAHGGTMWITSELNRGTTFHFTLPVNRENHANDQTITEDSE